MVRRQGTGSVPGRHLQGHQLAVAGLLERFELDAPTSQLRGGDGVSRAQIRHEVVAELDASPEQQVPRLERPVVVRAGEERPGVAVHHVLAPLGQVGVERVVRTDGGQHRPHLGRPRDEAADVDPAPVGVAPPDAGVGDVEGLLGNDVAQLVQLTPEVRPGLRVDSVRPEQAGQVGTWLCRRRGRDEIAQQGDHASRGDPHRRPVAPHAHATQQRDGDGALGLGH